MVTRSGPAALAPWQDAHFIGGHPVLDLTNTVFDRANPAPDNELLKTPSDVFTWCASVGLIANVPALPDSEARVLIDQVRSVREHAWAVFDAVARNQPVPTTPFGALLALSGTGVRSGHLRHIDADLHHLVADGAAPGALPAALSLLAVQALFTLPAERVRACGRCGWLFLDDSRGGRRRWCSMSTCGNREKASRHRRAAQPAR